MVTTRVHKERKPMKTVFKTAIRVRITHDLEKSLKKLRKERCLNVSTLIRNYLESYIKTELVN